MGLTYVSQLSLPLLCPSVWLSVGNVSAGLSASLQGNLSLAASFTATPPTLSSQLSASLQISSNIVQAIAAIPPVPAISFSLSDVVALQASISASVSLYLPALLGLLAVNAGIYSFAYEGTGTGLGSAITGELATVWPDGAPTTGACTALIFGAVAAASPAAPAALPAFLSGLTFGSGLIYTGKMGLPAMLPLVSGAAAQGAASLSAQAAAAAQIKVPAVPPLFPSMLAAQAAFYANIKATGAISPPSLTVKAALSAAASLSANFGASCSLGATLSTGATFFVYVYTGTANAMGAALTTALASTWGDALTPTSGACVASMLAATDVLSIGALTGLFNGA